MKTKQDCVDALRALGIVHELIEHAEVFTIEEAMAEPALQGRTEIKNLFIQDDKGKRQYLVMMPGLKRLDLKQLATDLDEKKVRFCSAEKVERMLGVKPGSVSLFCCLNDSSSHVEIIVDKELMDYEDIGMHPIVNDATVYVDIDGFKKLLTSFNQTHHIIKL